VLPSSSTTSIAHPFHPRRVFFLDAAADEEPAGVEGALSNGVAVARAAVAEEPARAPSNTISGASDEGAGLTSDEAR
jgi:hypothetical protein